MGYGKPHLIYVQFRYNPIILIDYRTNSMKESRSSIGVKPFTNMTENEAYFRTIKIFIYLIWLFLDLMVKWKCHWTQIFSRKIELIFLILFVTNTLAFFPEKPWDAPRGPMTKTSTSGCTGNEVIKLYSEHVRVCVREFVYRLEEQRMWVWPSWASLSAL